MAAMSGTCSSEDLADLIVLSGTVVVNKYRGHNRDTPITRTATIDIEMFGPEDFSSAVFDGKNLHIRRKCRARFKPRCLGSAQALSGHGKRAKPITASISAAQKRTKWKVVELKVKPKCRSLVA